ncbi:MAG TPA: LytTR family DNA-binding domain-containing protein [Chitinophagaceae bacterium]|nr:LytTR family DNA-binding domain-containing protein [Chitinophagaceae bacterium]
MLNCLVVDDEPIARNGLMEHIRQIDFLNPVAECKSAMEATTWLQKKDIDLIFLDIQMPKLTGIDFIKNSSALPVVIFTTAYPEYAIEGYELDILDYLLKPISFNRFLKAALKAQEFLGLRTRHETSTSEDFFFIKCNQKIEKIMMADVLYVEGMSNYIIVHTKQKKYIAYLTFKGIEEKLPQSMFIRTHKSFLVSIHAIQSIDGNEIKLEKITLPISKNYKEEVMYKIGERLFKR